MESSPDTHRAGGTKACVSWGAASPNSQNPIMSQSQQRRLCMKALKASNAGRPDTSRRGFSAWVRAACAGIWAKVGNMDKGIEAVWALTALRVLPSILPRGDKAAKVPAPDAPGKHRKV